MKYTTKLAGLMGAAGLAVAVGMTAGLARADVSVVYSAVPLSPTATVPGAVDLSGAPVVTQFATMPEFWLSPDGTRWLIRGTTSQATDQNTVVVLGMGTSGSVVVQEGRPFPGAVGSEVVDFVSTLNPQPFNANNQWVFPVRARGGTTGVANKIIRWDAAGVGTLRFQQGGAYTGLTDLAPAVSGDEQLGNSQASAHLLNDGRIGWQDNSVTNLSSTRRPVTAYDAVKHLQSRLDTVTAIDGMTPILITNIGSTGTLSVFQTSPDGTRVVFRGSVDQDNNGSPTGDPDVVVVDGQVRVQEGLAIPGSTIVPTAINSMYVAPNNDWYARGTDSAGVWATRNGVVIAKTGDAVGADAWASSFLAIIGNTSGDWAIAGKTNNANTAIDDVVVVNGQVVLREGDAVSIDIDGNGTAETAYIGRANTTLAAFTANSAIGLGPDETLYILANLRSAQAGGTDLGPSAGAAVALIRVTPPAPSCPADYNNSGSVTVQDIFDFLSGYFSGAPAADFNGVGGLTVQDIFDYLTAYFQGC